MTGEGNLISQTFWREGIEVPKKEFYGQSLSLLDDKLDELHLKNIISSFL